MRCYHIEIAQTFLQNISKQELFFKSMLYSLSKPFVLIANGILEDFKARITAISLESNDATLEQQTRIQIQLLKTSSIGCHKLKLFKDIGIF
jgi:hypothetical protein